ncbi:hypothetical protein GYL69_000106 [Vibrio vulnificus]|nr:hypothetical protein [Vibrio vulnificus]
MINSSKEFRQLVVKTEDVFKRGSLNGAFVVLDEIKQSIKSPVRAVKLCTLIQNVIQNRSGRVKFEDRAREKLNLKMRLKLIEQRNRNQIRKQEEAPEALAVDGAESLPVLPSDYGCCDCCHDNFNGEGYSVGEGRFVCAECRDVYAEAARAFWED